MTRIIDPTKPFPVEVACPECGQQSFLLCPQATKLSNLVQEHCSHLAGLAWAIRPSNAAARRDEQTYTTWSNPLYEEPNKPLREILLRCLKPYHGFQPETPYTCEVRNYSVIISGQANPQITYNSLTFPGPVNTVTGNLEIHCIFSIEPVRLLEELVEQYFYIQAQARADTLALDQREIFYGEFQPFADRAEADPADTVMSLKFKYSESLVNLLKSTFRELKPRLNLSTYPGGWLAEHRLWFVEKAAWEPLKERLLAAKHILRPDPSPPRTKAPKASTTPKKRRISREDILGGPS